MNIADYENHIETQFLLLKEYGDDPSYDEEVPFDDSIMEKITEWINLKLEIYDEEIVETLTNECYFELLNGCSIDNINLEHMYRNVITN